MTVAVRLFNLVLAMLILFSLLTTLEAVSWLYEAENIRLQE